MKTTTRPKLARHVDIRYHGGPLDRRRATTTNTAKYRDADGIPMPTQRGRDLLDASRRLGFFPSIYFLDEDRRTYRFLPAVVVEQRNNWIKELLQEKAEHPERAAAIELKIREIEGWAE